MSETAATPSEAPASVDDVLALLDREDDQQEQAAGQPPALTEPDTSQATDPEAQPQEQPPEPRYTVKVRGQEVEVTLDELRNGYSRTEDYKAKTAEVAEQRRAAERLASDLAARTQQLDTLMERVEFDPVLAEGQKTDWQALARDNPAEYVARKEQFEARVGYWRHVAQTRDAARAQADRQALEAGEARMREAIPEWADEGKRRELQGQMSKALEAYGFAPQEYQAVKDHRVLLVARDAMLWRQMQAERQAAAGKKAPAVAPKVMSPGTPQPNANAAKTRALLKSAAKSGRLDEQVNAVLAALE